MIHFATVHALDPLEVVVDTTTVPVAIARVVADDPGALVATLTVGARVGVEPRQIDGAKVEHVLVGRMAVAAAAGWITTGFSAAAGWTVSYAAYRLMGPLVEVRIELAPTTTKTFSATTGNITDENAATIPTAIAPPRPTLVMSVGQTTMSAFYLDGTDLRLVSGVPGSALAADTTVRAQVVYSI